MHDLLWQVIIQIRMLCSWTRSSLCSGSWLAANIKQWPCQGLNDFQEESS